MPDHGVAIGDAVELVVRDTSSLQGSVHYGYDVVGTRYILQYLLAAPVGTSIVLDTEHAPGLVLVGS
ncbi:hypothetical protein DB30_00033 [Enhygromyxa salina]|uniref:Uncharacterized protein n=1 Tax=Enhygromyxa salina TaxID=215803 RepID=A0A0C1ZPF1_9BACT|nr:hypothetical protein [Enhygromyxa salina]KIG19524.1 hypothetical protein DB30_00033 [Enhygromyxa salina]